MGHQRGGAEVERHVAARLAFVDAFEDFGIGGIVRPWGLAAVAVDAGEVLERRQVVVEDFPVGGPVLGGLHVSRTATAGDGGTDEAAFRVPVGRFRVLAIVEAGKAAGALAVLQDARVGEPEEVEEQAALAVVHPVVVGVELAVDLAILGPLPGDPVPDRARTPVDLLAAAERVEQRHIHEPLVGVVRTVHPRPAVAPDQRAIGAGVAVGELDRRRIERGEDLPLEQCPARDRGDGFRGDGRQVSNGTGHGSAFRVGARDSSFDRPRMWSSGRHPHPSWRTCQTRRACRYS